MYHGSSLAACSGGNRTTPHRCIVPGRPSFRPWKCTLPLLLQGGDLLPSPYRHPIHDRPIPMASNWHGDPTIRVCRYQTCLSHCQCHPTRDAECKMDLDSGPTIDSDLGHMMDSDSVCMMDSDLGHVIAPGGQLLSFFSGGLESGVGAACEDG